MLFDIFDDAVELVERLGGLRIEVDIAAEIELLHIVELGNDNCCAVCLPYKTEHFCMTGLAEDYQLSLRVGIILTFDAPLQLKHHGACGIYNLNVVLLCELVCLRRLAVGAQQHFRIVQLIHIFMVDGYEPQIVEPFAFHAVVHDVAEAIERVALCQFFFCLPDGGGHAETEAATTVDFYL